MTTLSQFPNVEEVYEVTGESDIVTLISTANIGEFHDFLENNIFKIQGIRGLCYKELQEIGGQVGWFTLARLLAFINIFVAAPSLGDVVAALSKLPNVEEVYEVTGEFDIVTLVSTNDIEEFRDFLKNKILKIPGVHSTVTSIVLHTAKGHRNTVHTETTESASQ
jgi:DNA-binding Lrp family transcriptional regulator